MERREQTTRLLAALLFAAFFGITITGCPVGYGCYRDPKGCEYENCTMVVTWKASSDNESVDFSISARHNSITPRWAAIGFSTDKKMVSENHL